MAPSLDVALVTTGWNPFSLIYKKIIPDSHTLSISVWVCNAQRLLLANTMAFYPTLTNFWIVLILKSSEDLALIR